MAIEITIINSPSNANVSQSQHTFPDAGGTLGRGNNNFWVLDDPNKYMSSVHAKIICAADQYFLTDLSTNGTFVNGASEPIGNGNQVALNDGDHFTISDYEFITKINSSTPTPAMFENNNSADPFADFSDLGDPQLTQDDLILSSSSNNDPFSSGIHQSSSGNEPLSAFDAEKIDPLALLDDAQAMDDPFAQSLSGFDSPSIGGFGQDNPIADNFASATSSSIESNNVANDAISWPKANQDSSLIPDDWDDDDLMSDFSPSPVIPPAQQASAHLTTASPFDKPIQSAPVANASVAKEMTIPTTPEPQISQQSNVEVMQLQHENERLTGEIAKLKQQVLQLQSTQQQSSGNISNSQETQSVVNAMGLAKWNLSDKKVTEINDTVGLLMRETMQGMMRVLKFRKKIKEEFRINVTTIQSIENNPLKFSANIDDALENMFIKENNAYKSPIDAVKEGFQGIAEHQVAVIAGMQAAFRGMIDRFDPINLENRFEKYKSSSLLSIGQKSKRWGAYKEYHQGLTENLDDSFQHLFGYDFVQAYEEQMQRLISERFSPSDNQDPKS